VRAADSYWGDGGDGSGKNMLGKILMRVRDELRGQQEPTNKAQKASRGTLVNKRNNDT
jgi:hypothetical protein